MSKNGLTTKNIILSLVMVLLVTNQLSASSAFLKTNPSSEVKSDPLPDKPIFLPVILNPCFSCYFVDSINGSDSNPGTSSQYPWQTLDRVNRMRFTPGSKIFFKRGSSWTGRLKIFNSGVQGAPILYSAYGDGPKPIIRNPGTPSNYTKGINLQASWIIVEGLHIEDTYQDGIFITADHNIIRDNEINNVGTGIDIEGQYNLIFRNTIHNLHMIVNTVGGNNDDYGANGILMDNGSGNEISYNTVYECAAPSYDFKVGGHAFEMFHISYNNFIHHNLAYNNGMFLEVSGGEAKGDILAYNVSIDNGVFSYISSNTENFRVENNTIVDTNRIVQGQKVIGFSRDPSLNSYVLRNNIFYITSLDKIVQRSSFTHDYNIYYVGQKTVLGFPLNSNEKLVDPHFVNLQNNDFHLRPDSQAIDAGVNLNYHSDFDRAPVPVGSYPDIGAYEFQK